MRSVLAAAVLFSAPLQPANVHPLIVISPDAIVQVICISKTEIDSGTAFRVGNGLFLSVNHVTSSKGQCFIGSNRISIAYKSPSADFSMLNADAGSFLQVDCGGFVKGRKYLAIGFARAVSPATIIELTATGDWENGQAILSGMLAVIPGMSGGPIIDEDTGKVVGTVNAENFEDGLSWSVPLSTTPVCRKVA